MYRFFDVVTRPLLDAMKASIVVEVGSDRGHQTELLASWCKDAGAILHCIDPLPKYDVEEWKAHWGETIEFHLDLSLNVLPLIGSPDVVCIDGDHNWYTVHHELEILERSATVSEAPFPLTILHDVGWPYGRRDLYYDPDTIPAWYRHPHRKAALSPARREPTGSGFNDHLENAIHEGTPRNGVLTAAEDFVGQTSRDLVLRVLPGIHGLGLLAEKATVERLGAVWDELAVRPALRAIMEAVEKDRLDHLLRAAELKRSVAKERERTARAKEAAAQRQERLSRAEAELELSQDAVATLRDQLAQAHDGAREKVQELAQVRAEAQSARVDAESARAAVERSRIDARRRVDDARRQADERLRREQTQRREALRARDQELAALQIRLSRAEHAFERLRNRRSVRFILRIAQLARPLFRLRRGQTRWANRRRRPSSSRPTQQSAEKRGSPREDVRTVPRSSDTSGADETAREFAEGSGRFYQEIGSLVRSGVERRFLDAWRRSEADLGQDDRELADQPLVSIILPTYNRAELIGDALTSALEQSYHNFELLVCDDGSEDNTDEVVRSFDDERIVYLRLAWGGAARARNEGLARSSGDVIAYLDSDNLWHPRFLASMVAELVAKPGCYAAYSRYVDVTLSEGDVVLKKYASLPFDYDRLASKNFIDLNGFVHRRVLYEHFGGFNEELMRQQDWELILRYTYLRDPLYIDRFLFLYRRSSEWGQITQVHRADRGTATLIKSAVDEYYEDGLPSIRGRDLPSLSVLSWDICRNHFSKAYNIAEAMSPSTRVQLQGFQFFDEPIFPPYADATPDFRTDYLPGGVFPEWCGALAEAVARVEGDVLYSVKPRLPSLGVALLSNYHFGKPIVLETNDLESVVTNPATGQQPEAVALSDVDPADPRLLNPYGHLWTCIMEGLGSRVPLRATHNGELDQHFGGGAFLIRNSKDERYYDPSKYDRDVIRARLGFSRDERVLLFGGMVRRHKGIFEFAKVLEHAGSQYRMLVVGSRETPDQRRLREQAGENVRIVGPVDRNAMAEINFACDAVVLWLDPDVAASRFQMPYKLTDAFAMQVPVFANDVGDLGGLGRDGYLRLVRFGDHKGLISSMEALWADQDARRKLVERSRRLYLRQFSYAAVRLDLELMLDQAMETKGTLQVADEFAEFFARFRAHLGSEGSASSVSVPS